jgi:hypothetical protein
VAYLIAILVSLALLIGFVVLTRYEARLGRHFFATERAELDKSAKRIAFIIEHVDLAAFVQDEVHHAANTVGHTVANLSLQMVRAVERLLTRVVRHLRIRNEGMSAPRENAREFVKTLSEFKETINATHPEVSGINKPE